MRPGSWFHRTECFGPVLGVMRADDLDARRRAAERRAYGLTGGLHSLDAAEIERWLDRVEVGNAYVNRHTTGAIVRRQPFGGWKRSSVGRGAKTGGPDDVDRFVTFRRVDPPMTAAADSYEQWWRDRFAREIDRTGLRSESNVLRYRPVRRVLVRASVDTPVDDVAALRAAAAVAGVPVDVSLDESDEELAARHRRHRRRAVAGAVTGAPTSCDPPATRPASPSTPRRSPATAASSSRAGCASRRSRGPGHRHGRVPASHDQHDGDDLHDQQGGDDAGGHPVTQVR